jgi:hypothetical protein
MLVRLMYASRASEQIGTEDLAAILRVSKANNPATGVTERTVTSPVGTPDALSRWRRKFWGLSVASSTGPLNCTSTTETPVFPAGWCVRSTAVTSGPLTNAVAGKLSLSRIAQLPRP